MSHHTDYRTLVSRGRKAGLNTCELYRALAARPGDGDPTPEHADCNGFIAGYNQQGQRVIRPLSGPAQP